MFAGQVAGVSFTHVALSVLCPIYSQLTLRELFYHLTDFSNTLLDPAFLRRLRFVVSFPFPDAKWRTEIWRRIFPKQTPTQGLKFDKLGQLSLAGGNIRNIAINATFLAAEAGESVTMEHLLSATKSEYGKLEKTLTATEIHGWV